MDLSLIEIASITNGQLIGDDLQISGISTDTRNMHEDMLFVALIGESFDPHELIEKDMAHKAAAVLVQREVKTSSAQIIVQDCYKALQEIATAWRKKFSLPIVGVTGSNGKTSVKELIKQILSTQGNVLATQGNLNNHIGVPITLCQLTAEHDYAVIEMGANHAGEIACLTNIAQPNIGVITNIGPAHLEGFGSIDGVARAKAELYANLNPSGVVVVNADDAYSDSWQKEIGDRMQISFGMEKPADVSGKQISDDLIEIATPMGEIRVKPQVRGMHAVLNILAATGVALAIGVDLEDIKTGIENTRAVEGRLMRIAGLAGAIILDDTYNANPASLAAALDVQAQEPGEHWLVLGDMGELGDESEFMHNKAGEIAKQFGVQRLFACGEMTKHSVKAFGKGAKHFSSHAEIISALQDELTKDICVLVKGSRAMQLEKIVTGIKSNKVSVNKKLNGQSDGENDQISMKQNEYAA